MSRHRKTQGLNLVFAAFLIVIAVLSVFILTDTSKGDSIVGKLSYRVKELSAPVVEFFTGENPITGRTREEQQDVNAKILDLKFALQYLDNVRSAKDLAVYAKDVMDKSEALASTLAMDDEDIKYTATLTEDADPSTILQRTEINRVRNPIVWDDYRLWHIYNIRNSYSSFVSAMDETKSDQQLAFTSDVRSFMQFAATSPIEEVQE